MSEYVSLEQVQEGLANGDNWKSFSECREDPDLFFPPEHFERKPVKDARVEAAKAICRRCPVIEQCYDNALETHDFYGIQAGLTGNELQAISKRQMREAS